MRTSEDLTRLVRSSGFPLQAAIDQLLSSQPEGLGWKVLYREHGWPSPDGETRFLDLVLEDQYKTSVLVLECKRVQEADWLFLSSTGTFAQTLDARIWVSNARQDGSGHHGYYDARISPSCEQAMFCVVAGQDAKSRPMLERTAAETLMAMEQLAHEERPLLVKRAYGLRMYAAVIVTTARLHISRFSPTEVDLKTGEPANAEHQAVPWVRFRKQFSSELAVTPRNLQWDFAELGRAKEKQVFVVNAQELPKFLAEWGALTQSLHGAMQ